MVGGLDGVQLIHMVSGCECEFVKESSCTENGGTGGKGLQRRAGEGGRAWMMVLSL